MRENVLCTLNYEGDEPMRHQYGKGTVTTVASGAIAGAGAGVSVQARSSVTSPTQAIFTFPWFGLEEIILDLPLRPQFVASPFGAQGSVQVEFHRIIPCDAPQRKKGACLLADSLAHVMSG